MLALTMFIPGVVVDLGRGVEEVVVVGQLGVVVVEEGVGEEVVAIILVLEEELPMSLR